MLPKALRELHTNIIEAGAKGIVIAAEIGDARIIRDTFEQLGYKIHQFDKLVE